MTDSELDSNGEERGEAADSVHWDLPELETLTRGQEWGDEAFRDAGEATVGGR